MTARPRRARPRPPSASTARAPLAIVLALAGAVASPLAAQDAPRPDTAVRREAAAARAAALYGRLADGRTGEPLAGAEVVVDGPTPRRTRTAADGRWQVVGLAPGRYVVRARHIGHIARATTVDLAAGARAEPALVLEPAVLPLDAMIVTAARREQRLGDAVVTTELVSRAEIAETGASDLAAVLTERTGVELQGGHPAGAGVMLQGIGSERVLILLDGQPIAGRIAGVFDVSRIPASSVERIEIVKGPQSTLYGSEAMGGVVNIITRRPPTGRIGAHATLLAGTESRLDGSAGVSGGTRTLAGALDASRRTIENTPGRDETLGALAERTDLAARAHWSPDASLIVDAGLLALDERQRWRAGSLFQFADNRQWTGRLGASWRRGAHRLAPTLSASSFDHLARESAAPKPIAGDPGDRQVQRLLEAELLYNVALGAHALDLGVEAKREETRAERVEGERRTLHGVEPFAQAEVVLGSVAVVPGVRVSWNEQWGTHTTPRLAARWRAGERLTLRASAGTGYRAPDFKELYMFFQNESANYSVRGNPDLRPEHSRNATVGAEWSDGAVYARGQLFWNEFRDFIETRPISAPDEPAVYQYANVDDGLTRGAEVEAGAFVGIVRIEGAWSLLDTEDRGTGRPLLGRPTHALRATIGSPLPLALRAAATVVVTGRTPMERDDATGAITGWRETYARLDARLARALPGGLELVVGADNLFDRRPARWAGFTGRHVYTSLSWTFDRALARGTP
ncbi:MAG TPA: TonB-dependent receptor [Gemmatimonadaceae bacterium]